MSTGGTPSVSGPDMDYMDHRSTPLKKPRDLTILRPTYRADSVYATETILSTWDMFILKAMNITNLTHYKTML